MRSLTFSSAASRRSPFLPMKRYMRALDHPRRLHRHGEELATLAEAPSGTRGALRRIGLAGARHRSILTSSEDSYWIKSRTVLVEVRESAGNPRSTTSRASWIETPCGLLDDKWRERPTRPRAGRSSTDTAAYGQVVDTILTLSTFSVGALAADAGGFCSVREG